MSIQQEATLLRAILKAYAGYALVYEEGRILQGIRDITPSSIKDKGSSVQLMSRGNAVKLVAEIRPTLVMEVAANLAGSSPSLQELAPLFHDCKSLSSSDIRRHQSEDLKKLVADMVQKVPELQRAYLWQGNSLLDLAAWLVEHLMAHEIRAVMQQVIPGHEPLKSAGLFYQREEELRKVRKELSRLIAA